MKAAVRIPFDAPRRWAHPIAYIPIDQASRITLDRPEEIGFDSLINRKGTAAKIIVRPEVNHVP